ncbi:MAG: bls [Candidatus Eremiobacteraeota bacterium]|nr:bls [Candidatus Eremiobacteraeota bacterium]
MLKVNENSAAATSSLGRPPTSVTVRVRRTDHDVDTVSGEGTFGASRVSQARIGNDAAVLIGHLDDPSAAANPARHLLEILQSHGDELALDLISGRFAAVVVRDAEIVMITDHAGMVPLYYTVNDGMVTISSRLIALAGGAERRMAPPAPPGPSGYTTSTFLEGVSRVPLGSVVRLDRAGMARATTRRYWYPSVRVRYRDEAAAAALVRTALAGAYGRRRDRHATADQCFVISGGIDSSALLATAAAQSATRLRTYSIGTAEVNEFAEARLVAGHVGSAHTEELFTTDDLLASLPHALLALESTETDFLEYTAPLMLLYGRMRGEKVVHTGYGSDLMFGGNLKSAPPPAAVHQHCIDELESIDASNEFSVNLGWRWELETEHSYLDRDFLETAMSIDPALKIAHGIPKYVLRLAFRDMLPEATVWRKKIGIHEATGTRSLLDTVVGGGTGGARKRSLVRSLAAMIFCDGAHPADVDMEMLVDAARRSPA